MQLILAAAALILAIVSPVEGKTAANGLDEDLKAHVKTKAGVWKYPRWIAFVDGLPKTATGKIQRFKLREG